MISLSSFPFLIFQNSAEADKLLKIQLELDETKFFLFSPDGEYLASAGKDGIVRVWKVVAAEAPKDLNSQGVDPSCLYFSLSHLSKLASLDIDKEMIGQLKKSRKSSESACVILPPKVFRILEQPVHEFHGHVDEVLALSWSGNEYLLSSSVDKTARLWQVGHDQCLGVYPHNNCVTCVEFNPVDDHYFISGSIDGKVRLWEVQRCRVIDWTDVKEIVTAVCYFPDGKELANAKENNWISGNNSAAEILEIQTFISGAILARTELV
nr:WD repeat-containing protein 44-like [Ipomoea batatas]